MKRSLGCKLFLGLAILSLDCSFASAQNVTTYKYDNHLSGINANETVLTPVNVNVSTFGQLFAYSLDGQAYAQPLYLSNVTIPDKGTHNVVYVATCHDTVYAFDADNGTAAPLWQTSFLSPAVGAGITTVGQSDVITGDINPEVGIVGTPVIDAKTGTLYVVSKTKETGRGDGHTHFVQKLHALDVTTGTEKFNGPQVIGDTTCDNPGDRKNATYDLNLDANPKTPSAKGTGYDAINGVVYFNALRTNQRPSLALSNGVVYVAWASHGDNRPYHGWLIGFDATTLAPIPEKIFCVTPDGEEGGIWQSGCGPAIDDDGNLYISTGNGTFDGNKGGRNWSQSFLKFITSAGLSTAKATAPDQTFDYFTPYNEKSLSNGDVDLGSGGFMIFDVPGAPTPHLSIGSGKAGVLYMLNRDNLGQFDDKEDHVVQEFESEDRHETMSTPIYFNNTIFYNRSGEDLRARAFANGKLADTYNRTASSFNGRGGGPVISAHGTADGVIWMLNNGGPASLQAFSVDALTSSATTDKVPALYNGRMPDGGVKFTHPVVINGKVYAVCASARGNSLGAAHLCVFGLLTNAAATAKPVPPTKLQASSNSPEVVNLTWVAGDSTASGFIIKRSTGDSTDFTQIGTADGNATTYADKTVTGATTYNYAVYAVNSKGTSDKSDTATIQSHAFIADDGLIAYWALDEGTGTTTLDLTGKGHNGALKGEISWSQGIQNSSAINFHGTGNAMSHIEVGDQADLKFGPTDSYSLVAWARPSALPNQWAGVVVKSRETPTGMYGLYISPENKWAFRSTDKEGIISGGTVLPNSWQQIVAVQDGAAKTRTLYVNGTQVATTNVTEASDGSGVLWIGQGNAEMEGFSGNIDDVRIYNRALTAADIQNLLGTYLPTINLTSPKDKTVLTAEADLTISATATANGATVSQVRFYQGTTLLGTVSAAPYNYVWKKVPAGTYAVTATVTDSNGNSTTTLSSIAVQVNP